MLKHPYRETNLLLFGAIVCHISVHDTGRGVFRKNGKVYYGGTRGSQKDHFLGDIIFE